MRSASGAAKKSTEKIGFDEVEHVGKVEYTTAAHLQVCLLHSDKSDRWYVMAQEMKKETNEEPDTVRHGDGLFLSEYTLTRLIAALQDARQKIGSLQTRKRTEAA